MNQGTFKFTTLALVVSLFFTGCASTKDGRLTQGQGAGLGALLGAGLGVALAAATGDTSLMGRAAAIGAAAGAAAGYAYGTQVAQKKQQYATQEDFLNDAIIAANKSNEEAVAANAQLLAEVKSLESRYGSVGRSDVETKKTLKLEGDNHLAAIDTQVKKLDTEIADYNECLNGEGYGNKAQSETLRGQIRSLEGEKAKLLKAKTRLASAQTRIAI